jgi:hypothetical protein
VGELSQSYLTVGAMGKIYDILDGASLARVSTWPDDIKSDPVLKKTWKWHYTEWPEGTDEHSEEGKPGQLLTGINSHLATLRDPVADKSRKAFALKFLVHLIGDLHMPLHVGNGVDQRAGYCKVFYHDHLTNLHHVWDEDMIDRTKLSFTEMASFLKPGIKIDDLNAWRSGTPLDWALESKILRETVYPAELSGSSSPLPSPIRQYCRKDAAQSDLPRLSFEYTYTFMPVVERRLSQAAVRLAHLLNQVL